MNTSSLINAVANVGVAYLAVLNTNTLVMAVVAYTVGLAIVGLILRKAGVANGSMTIVDWVGLAVVLYIFYRKYGVSGAVISIILSGVLQILLGSVLNMF